MSLLPPDQTILEPGAEGITINGGVDSTPIDTRRVRWVRQADGALMADVYAYDPNSIAISAYTPSGPNQFSQAAVYANGPGGPIDLDHRSGLSAASDGSGANSSLTRSGRDWQLYFRPVERGRVRPPDRQRERGPPLARRAGIVRPVR
jgi:hypothetical protein